MFFSSRSRSSSGTRSKWSSMARLLRPVTKISSLMPDAIASSTAYWMRGRSTMGSISFGMALVAGRKRVPSPATGNTAFLIGCMQCPFLLVALTERATRTPIAIDVPGRRLAALNAGPPCRPSPRMRRSRASRPGRSNPWSRRRNPGCRARPCRLARRGRARAWIARRIAREVIFSVPARFSLRRAGACRYRRRRRRAAVPSAGGRGGGQRGRSSQHEHGCRE